MPKSKNLDEKDAELMHPLNDDGVVIEMESLRPAWGSKFQYFGMVISTAVGLGNVWRFPYLCQKHGGGLFIFSVLFLSLVTREVSYRVNFCVFSMTAAFLHET